MTSHPPVETAPPAPVAEWTPTGHPVRWAVGLFVIVLTLSFVASATGAVAPHVRVSGTAWTEATSTRVVVLTLTLANERSAAVRIERVGASLPGLRLLSVQRAGPAPAPSPFQPGPLEHGSSLAVVLTYVVVDCAAIPTGFVAIPVQVRSVLGRRITLGERVSLRQRPGSPSTYTYDGAVDPYDEPWQTTITRGACPR